MALVFDSHPSEVITNEPEFGLLTSLVEDSTHQNLRVRATVYIGGESSPVAVLEQPKGLPDFDLSSLLKNLSKKCSAQVGNTDHNVQPSLGSELLTGWANYYSTFTSFSSSGRKILTTYDTSGGTASTNTLGSQGDGDIFVVAVEYDYLDNGVADFILELVNSGSSTPYAQTRYAGLTSGELKANHLYFLMSHSSGTPAIFLRNLNSGTCDLYGTFSVRKISDFKNNPGVYFHVKFEEVYEDASNVTTIGAEEWSDTLLYIPATVRNGESFNDYMANPTGGKFLSRIEDGDIKFKFGIGMEIRAMYISTSAYLRTNIITDAGTTTENVNNAGWGMLVLNDLIASIDADDETVTFTLESIRTLAGSAIANIASVTFDCEQKCYQDMKALSFVGDLGEEVVLFKGLMTWTGEAEKTFTKNERRIRKVLRAFKKFNMMLRTVYETEEVRRLLHELIYTELPVWLYNDDAADNYTEVTVITDELPITDEDELLESEIEIEYYE